MNNYDLCILWNWEFDADFVGLLDAACSRQDLSVLQVTPDNLAERLNQLKAGWIDFRVFLDRASEDDDRFMPFVNWANQSGRYYINRYELARRSCDKAALHYDLIRAGLHTPYSFILPPYAEQPEISGIDRDKLGERFIFKPVRGSGGEGVVMDLAELSQVMALRKKDQSRRHLLQACITPRMLDNRPAWFRVLYCRGKVYPCWWHTETHRYSIVTPDVTDRFGLEQLSQVTATLAAVSGLDIFSTEIAFTDDDLFVVVDYVNDQPDLRRQSAAVDGVPDEIVLDIVERLAQLVAENCRTQPARPGTAPG
ncbi:MAG: hypothetical protein ABIA75_05030 [Candidatus Neomarinimicrobiota bacterium]